MNSKLTSWLNETRTPLRKFETLEALVEATSCRYKTVGRGNIFYPVASNTIYRLGNAAIALENDDGLRVSGAWGENDPDMEQLLTTLLTGSPIIQRHEELEPYIVKYSLDKSCFI